jgi:hypothetical protein
MIREQLIPIIQRYIGMTPKDCSCTNWNEMQEKMANEIMELDGLDMPHRKIDDWIFKAREDKKDYIIVAGVRNEPSYVDYPIYCQDFQEMHDKYHDVHLQIGAVIRQIIRINHDGTAEENLQLHNLL